MYISNNSKESTFDRKRVCLDVFPGQAFLLLLLLLLFQLQRSLTITHFIVSSAFATLSSVRCVLFCFLLPCKRAEYSCV